MIKVNFGCGSIQPVGWVNVDFDETFKAPVKHLGEIDDNSVDIIVAHCVLQITETKNLDFLLRDILRVLKPGGTVRISLPDIIRGFKEYELDNKDWFPNNEDFIDDRFSNWLTWYSTTRTLLTAKSLRYKLHKNEFERIHGVRFKETVSNNIEILELDTRENECYFMEASKWLRLN